MRYIIGIDLGTTNTCVSYVDTTVSSLQVHSFRIPQLTQLGHIEALPTLPSFCYLTAPDEWPSGTLTLPWHKTTSHQDIHDFVGRLAQAQGARTPTRLVQSAKSWLCHAGANRRDKIIPFEASSDERRMSPVEASARYLQHIREAWNEGMAKGNIDAEFEEQEIILTVPASFDEVARALTVEAAKLAGLNTVTLLEEPQAAFYSWISQHEQAWEKQLKAGDRILVCDVGGGTTDFSLIEVMVDQKDSTRLAMQRMAVGEHLLLGGDNMDIALVHYLEQKLTAENPLQLSSSQWLQLRHEARCAKEALLSAQNGKELYPVVLQGSGASVVQGSVSTSLSREEILSFLESGFFALYPWEEALKLRKTQGLRTMGLPYEDEPSITKHLAAFLNQCGRSGAPCQPDYILFNGGAMKAPVFQKAIVDSLHLWFPEKETQVLPSFNLDLAVARGAAYYGKVRRGFGVRIGGGTARGYYLEVVIKDPKKTALPQALTLLPRGSEEGSVYEPDQTFWLQPNTPVTFQLYTSHVRLDDQSGDLVEIQSEEMHPLPPIHTVLRFGKASLPGAVNDKIPVHLGIRLTAIGTLELWLKALNTPHTWSLEFQIRSAAGQENSVALIEQGRADETFDVEYLKPSKKLIGEMFSGEAAFKPEQIMERLEQALGRSKKEWSTSVLRGLWDELLLQAGQRKLSPDHEARWWNLAGFFLRPGFGYPLDDFRMKELWKIILGDLKRPIALEVQIQQWICYRRIAGGLSKGQQAQLANDLLNLVLNKRNGKIEAKGKGELYQYAEKIRALAALELMEVPLKTKLGNALLERILQGQAVAADYWAFGRIGARHLVYGTAAQVVPRIVCQEWVGKLLTHPKLPKDQMAFVLGQLARKSDCRELNLPSELIEKVQIYFSETVDKERIHTLLFETRSLTAYEQEQVLGDRLPVGLTLEK